MYVHIISRSAHCSHRLKHSPPFVAPQYSQPEGCLPYTVHLTICSRCCQGRSVAYVNKLPQPLALVGCSQSLCHNSWRFHWKSHHNNPYLGLNLYLSLTTQWVNLTRIPVALGELGRGTLQLGRAFPPSLISSWAGFPPPLCNPGNHPQC